MNELQTRRAAGLARAPISASLGFLDFLALFTSAEQARIASSDDPQAVLAGTAPAA